MNLFNPFLICTYYSPLLSCLFLVSPILFSLLLCPVLTDSTHKPFCSQVYPQTSSVSISSADRFARGGVHEGRSSFLPPIFVQVIFTAPSVVTWAVMPRTEFTVKFWVLSIMKCILYCMFVLYFWTSFGPLTYLDISNTQSNFSPLFLLSDEWSTVCVFHLLKSSLLCSDWYLWLRHCGFLEIISP